jgi:hypothetical protein
MRGKECERVWGKSGGWSVRRADCNRLNDNAAVFEITLHVQSSAGWWRREGRWQSMYGSGLTQFVGGDRLEGRTIDHSCVDLQYE